MTSHATGQKRQFVQSDEDFLSEYEVNKRIRLFGDTMGCPPEAYAAFHSPIDTLLRMQDLAPGIVAAEVAANTNLGNILSALIADLNTLPPLLCKFCHKKTNVACVGKNCSSGVHFDGPDDSHVCGLSRPVEPPSTARAPIEEPMCYTCLMQQIACTTCSQQYKPHETLTQCAHPECTRFEHSSCTSIDTWKRSDRNKTMYYCGEHDSTQIVHGSSCGNDCDYTEMPGATNSEFVACGLCNEAQHVGDTGFSKCAMIYYACQKCDVACEDALLICGSCHAKRPPSSQCKVCDSGHQAEEHFPPPAWLMRCHVDGAMYRCHVCTHLLHDDEFCVPKQMALKTETGEKVLVCKGCIGPSVRSKKYIMDPEYLARKSQLLIEDIQCGLSLDKKDRRNFKSGNVSIESVYQSVYQSVYHWQNKIEGVMEKHFLEGCEAMTLARVVQAKTDYLFFKVYCPWQSFEQDANYDRDMTMVAVSHNRIQDLAEDVKTRISDALATSSRRQRAREDYGGEALLTENRMPWLLGISPVEWRERCGFTCNYLRVSPTDLYF
jgi:hypothetical protein